MSATREGPIILVLAGTYLPGYRAGGPVQSIAGIVEALSDEFQFRLVAQNHDFGAREPYEGIRTEVWTDVGDAKVMYLSRQGESWRSLWRLLRETPYDVLYINGIFNRHYSMFPIALWHLRLIPRVPVVLAPRGELSSGALGLKTLRKTVYVSLARVLGLYGRRPFAWHATSPKELLEIARQFPLDGRAEGLSQRRPRGVAQVAPNIAAVGARPVGRAPKRADALCVAFVGRVSRMKSLDFALRVLQDVKGQVSFDIYGPAEDEVYWADCRRLIDTMPPNVNVQYHGEVPHERVRTVFLAHDLCFLPTRGENFGHVIAEALCAGCPVLISDQTPWRGLEAEEAGWDLPLDGTDAFRAVMEECIAMGPDEWKRLSEGARRFGERRVADPAVVEQNRALFRTALALGRELSNGTAKPNTIENHVH